MLLGCWVRKVIFHATVRPQCLPTMSPSPMHKGLRGCFAACWFKAVMRCARESEMFESCRGFNQGKVCISMLNDNVPWCCALTLKTANQSECLHTAQTEQLMPDTSYELSWNSARTADGICCSNRIKVVLMMWIQLCVLVRESLTLCSAD